MNGDPCAPVLNLIKTREQASLLKVSFRDLENKLFNESFNLNKEFLGLPLSIGEGLLSSLKNKGISLNDKKKIQSFFEELISCIDKMSILTLEVAFEPSGRSVEKINSWLKENFKTQVLLDFIVNTSLIAGARIYFEGKVGDYSLRKDINKLT